MSARRTAETVTLDDARRLTRRQISALARRLAGTKTAREAWARLDRGELRGTCAEAEMRLLRFVSGG